MYHVGMCLKKKNMILTRVPHMYGSFKLGQSKSDIVLNSEFKNHTHSYPREHLLVETLAVAEREDILAALLHQLVDLFPLGRGGLLDDPEQEGEDL